VSAGTQGSTDFASSFKQGQACVHVQTEHSFTAKQWIFSWRPQPDSREIGLIIEDDLDLSPYAFRWLKAVQQRYGHQEDVYAYSLQMENVCFQISPYREAHGPKTDQVLLMPLWATWGFAPKGHFWRRFQDWYIEKSKDKSFKPYIEGVRATTWYKNFSKNNMEGSMEHELWVIHYVWNHRRKIYTLHCNLVAYTGQKNVLLANHRGENGLHYKGKKTAEGRGSEGKLLTEWRDSYVDFPEHVVPFDVYGNPVAEY
jgi:hypothetical protein